MQSSTLQNTTTELRPDSGLARADRSEVAEHLNNALADSYVLLANTQGVHWNVQGPLFYSIHKLTEEQYEDLFDAIDNIAERVRALGFAAPQTITEFMQLTGVKELEGNGTTKDKISTLIASNELAAERMRDGIRAAEAVDDVMTADLLTSRIGQHEENAWMLRATIAEA